MHGNVSEWCKDWYSAKAYTSGKRTDPEGPENGEHRAPRGGSWSDFVASHCRSTFRNGEWRPDGLGQECREFTIGFRVVMIRK